MLTRLEITRSARELWFERVKQELSASEQEQLALLKDEYQDRKKDLETRFKIDLRK